MKFKISSMHDFHSILFLFLFFACIHHLCVHEIDLIDVSFHRYSELK